MRSSSRSSTTQGDCFNALTFVVFAVLAATSGPAPAQDTSMPRFTNVARKSGIVFRHNFGGKRLENILMTTGAGCAFFDYDNDGWLDAYLVNGTNFDAKGHPLADQPTHSALFHNKDDGTFEDVTKTAGLLHVSYGQGCACADFDGDGFTDLYLTNYGKNRLYRNKGDGTFEDVTAKSGTGDPRWSAGAVFFDYDGDRDLDLYVANYVDFRPDMRGVHSSALSKRKGYKSFPGPRDYDPASDVLYRNNGDGTFSDVSKEAGIVEGGKGLNAIASDFDGDGDQDLFVANDTTPNFLYRNEGGCFEEIALEAGVAYDPDGVETAAMGLDIADINGDGKPDLYVTNMIFEFNNMYMNQGNLAFKDTTRAIGLDQDNYRHVGWATRFVDFNHDGKLDCFVANGHVVDYVEGFSQSITYKQQNMLFVGEANGRFRNVANECGKSLKRKRVSRGAAFGDYDNDGDIDILLANAGGRAELLRNDLPPNKRWLKVRLKGNSPNTKAIGAKVTAKLGKRTVHNEVRCSPAYLGSSDPTLHYGLRSPGLTRVVIEVTWPSGTKTSHEAGVGKLTVIDEPGAANGKR